MVYTIDTSQPIDWSAQGDQRILQDVINLINTWRYELPYNRTIGIDTSILDKPTDVAAAMYTAGVIEIVDLYEPRAKIKEVNFDSVDEEGNINCQVVVEIE